MKTRKTSVWVAAAMLCNFACASAPTPNTARKLGEKGDNQKLVEVWSETDKDPVRIAVIEALAEHPDDSGRALSARAATGSYAESVRLAAVRSLSRYDGSEVTSALISGLSDPLPAIRELSRATLSAKGVALQVELRECAKGHPSHLARAGALSVLVGVAASDPEAKREVEAVLLQAAQSDEAPRVREQAVTGLGRLSVRSARSLLTELMRTDGDASVRMSASRALQQLGAAKNEESVVVAVLPLKNDTGTDDPEVVRLGVQVADYVSARLSSSRVCQVVDREKLEHALTELRKIGKQIYDGDAPNAPEIGKFKLAGQLVYGSVQKQGLTYTIVLNRMDVSTLEMVPGAAATVTGYRADLDRLKEEVTSRFVANFR